MGWLEVNFILLLLLDGFVGPVVAPADFFIRKMLNKQLAELRGVLEARG